MGVVVDAPSGEVNAGETVATAMGGMGRAFDGGYAEYTSVPANQIQVLNTSLDWDTLGALPEMIQTAWGIRLFNFDARSRVRQKKLSSSPGRYVRS